MSDANWDHVHEGRLVGGRDYAGFIRGEVLRRVVEAAWKHIGISTEPDSGSP